MNNIVYIGGFDTDNFAYDTSGYDHDPNGTGTVTVTGAGSKLSAKGMGVGIGQGTNGTLSILNGGGVESQIGVVGSEAGSTALVTVDGPGSTWRLHGGDPVGVMYASGDGDVVISHGGLVDVNGTNAQLIVGDSVSVGSEGQGTLIVANGGLLTSG